MADIEKIKKLRSLSGAGFKDCSSALDESKNDIDKAVEILRVKGISKASKKMSRSANEGVIAISEDNQNSSILEINCETDFVAKNEDFIIFAKELADLNNKVKSNREKLLSSKMKNGNTVEDNLLALISKIGEKITLGRSKTLNQTNTKIFKYHHTVVKDNLSKLGVLVSVDTNNESDDLKTFGKQLSMHIAASNPLAIDVDGIDQDVLKKEEQLINEELKNLGKPEDIVKKISVGKIKKFKEDNSLLNQQWVMEPKKKVKDIIKELNIDRLKINDFLRIKIGE
jgi:elongation factor Ts